MQKTRFPAVVATFILCLGFWVLITWSFTLQQLVGGAVVSLAVALFSARFFVHEESKSLLNPVRLLIAVFYWLCVFMVELFKANVDMAKRCFGGCKNINPGIVKVPVDLKTSYAQAALANSITLTPGTITMEITEEKGQNYFYIHWIDVSKPSGKEAGDKIKGTMEKWIRRIWE